MRVSAIFLELAARSTCSKYSNEETDSSQRPAFFFNVKYGRPFESVLSDVKTSPLFSNEMHKNLGVLN